MAYESIKKITVQIPLGIIVVTVLQGLYKNYAHVIIHEKMTIQDIT